MATAWPLTVPVTWAVCGPPYCMVHCRFGTVGEKIAEPNFCTAAQAAAGSLTELSGSGLLPLQIKVVAFAGSSGPALTVMVKPISAPAGKLIAGEGLADPGGPVLADGGNPGPEVAAGGAFVGLSVPDGGLAQPANNAAPVRIRSAEAAATPYRPVLLRFTGPPFGIFPA